MGMCFRGVLSLTSVPKSFHDELDLAASIVWRLSNDPRSFAAIEAPDPRPNSSLEVRHVKPLLTYAGEGVNFQHFA